MSTPDRRLIEETLPLREISAEAAREKSIRHGHISTLHIWWARRPLVACRAAVLAALLRDNGGEAKRKELLNFVTKFCTWQASTNLQMLNEARKLILENNAGQVPKVLDCFAGGGAIPFEAMRMGCEAFSTDLNPVAVLIEICSLIYPQRYSARSNERSRQTDLSGEAEAIGPTILAKDISKWGRWIFAQVEEELSRFYLPDEDGKIPVTYIWMHTLRCPNPRCQGEIPLFRNLELESDGKNSTFLQPVMDKKGRMVEFKIVNESRLSTSIRATVMRASVICLLCGSTVKPDQTRQEAKLGRMGQRLVAIVLSDPRSGKRSFRLANDKDVAIVSQAQAALKLVPQVGMLPAVPNERMPPIGTYGVDAQRYTMNETWGELFNPRQILSLVTFALKVRDAYDQILHETGDEEYAKALDTYLAFVVDRLADRNSRLCAWNVKRQHTTNTFGRQALGMVWDFAEINPLGDCSGNWLDGVEWLAKIISANTLDTVETPPPTVKQASATSLPYPDSYFDAVITDPPYYDAVPYSDLSDFFYVWLRRTLGNLYQDLLSTPLSPKLSEIVENPAFKLDGGVKDRGFFERQMTKALKEMNRVLKPEGIGAVVFAHKTTTAWETLIAALLNAGLMVTASWPMHTERPGRLRAHESAALASSVWLICRKKHSEVGVGSWKAVQAELSQEITERLDFFLTQDIKGADALLSAIGPALEVYGRYVRVEKVTGEQVTIAEFLDKVREVVAHHALSTVLFEQELGNVDAPTAFYVLWKWTFESTAQNGRPAAQGDKAEVNGSRILVPFDEALKLARSVGADLQILLKSHLLKQEKEYVRILDPHERKHLPGLGETARNGTPPVTIDMIHRALNLWAAMEQVQLQEYLESSGAQRSVIFRRVAQALSNLLPLQSREKQLLDGLLPRLAGDGEVGRSRDSKTLDEFIQKEER